MLQGGYTYVSVSLALVVASIMTLAFFSGASNDTRIEMLSRTNLVVKRLHNSVSMYYDKQCQTGAVPNPTINDLVNSGSLKDSSSVAFTKGATLDSITIEYNGAPPAIFKYKIKFLSQGDAEIAAGNRLNTVLSGEFVTWILANDHTNDSSISEGQEYLRAFGGNSC
ncbi:MAG: hypothetical protein CML20_18600 [Rheinheimera sp.]|nr:hypothetical protein [Rheinheimera sp.]|tara:strand:- start:1238 stop:1738 length:501 start_codon:yes stop_codon:yes gene_type:complete